MSTIPQSDLVYSYSAYTGITQSGGVISQWLDQVSSFPVVQSTEINKPPLITDGAKTVVQLDTTDAVISNLDGSPIDWTDILASGQLTIFFRVKTIDVGYDTFISFSGTTSTGINFGGGNGYNLRVLFDLFVSGGAIPSWTEVGDVSDYSFVVLTADRDADEYSLYFDGVKSGSTQNPGRSVWDQTRPTLRVGATHLVNAATYNLEGFGIASRIWTTGEIADSPNYSFELTPSPPTNLTATDGTVSIALAWDDNASNEDSYHVERKTEVGGTFSEMASIATDSTSYTDTGNVVGFTLVEGSTYYYRVRAQNAQGYSDYSNEDSAEITGYPFGIAKTARDWFQDHLSSLTYFSNWTFYDYLGEPLLFGDTKAWATRLEDVNVPCVAMADAIAWDSVSIGTRTGQQASTDMVIPVYALLRSQNKTTLEEGISRFQAQFMGSIQDKSLVGYDGLLISPASGVPITDDPSLSECKPPMMEFNFKDGHKAVVESLISSKDVYISRIRIMLKCRVTT